MHLSPGPAVAKQSGLAAAAPLLALFLTTACAPSAEPPPHLVLILVDTLRADRVGAYGHPRPTTPTLDALAARGILFEDAISSSSWTKPAVATLFTATLPSEHGAVSFDRPLPGSLPTLAESLREGGYRTVGVSGNFVHVNAEQGFARGFEVFEKIVIRDDTRGDPLLRMEQGEEAPLPLHAPTASEVTDRTLAALPEDAKAPLFLYVHYMDPHTGYRPPEPWRSHLQSAPETGPAATSDYVVALARRRARVDSTERQRLLALYDGEIAYADHELGRLLRELDARGFGRRVTVVLSDHGEEFGEHGGWFHGLTLHREVLHVPLIVHDARREREGVRRTEPVSLLDVPRTLLGLAGIEPPGSMGGRDLLAGAPLARSATVAELHPDALLEERAGPRRHWAALREGRWKAIAARNGRVELYDLHADPTEQAPVEASDPDAKALGARAAARARAILADAGPRASLSEAELEALRALGYVQ
jgi:arylsulfatase A-like enzyme